MKEEEESMSRRDKIFLEKLVDILLDAPLSKEQADFEHKALSMIRGMSDKLDLMNSRLTKLLKQTEKVRAVIVE